MIEKLLFVFHYKHKKITKITHLVFFVSLAVSNLPIVDTHCLFSGHCMGLTSSGWQFPQRFVFCYKLCFLSFNPKRKARTYCCKDRKGVTDVLLICSVVSLLSEILWNGYEHVLIFLRELSYEQNRFSVIDTIGKMYILQFYYFTRTPT